MTDLETLTALLQNRTALGRLSRGEVVAALEFLKAEGYTIAKPKDPVA